MKMLGYSCAQLTCYLYVGGKHRNVKWERSMQTHTHTHTEGERDFYDNKEIINKQEEKQVTNFKI